MFLVVFIIVFINTRLQYVSTHTHTHKRDKDGKTNVIVITSRLYVFSFLHANKSTCMLVTKSEVS